MEKLMAEAERLGKEQEALEERNRKRRAKGRQPLPDAQERQDMDVHRRRYRTGDPTTVDAADALKLFELRKAEMASPEDSGQDVEEDDEQETPAAPPPLRKPAKANKSGEEDEEKARRAAESARRVQDLKNGRIDHEGNWSDKGQTLEGGDGTVVVDKSEVGRIWGDEGQSEADKPQDAAEKQEEAVELKGTFLKDLYRRLGTSFEAIERTLSDLQGRVAEIVTATTPNAPAPEEGADEFKAMLSKKTPVVFDVGGTQMTFDAITVFHAPPCITVVSKIGSAKITPKPGAQLLLTYEMDGQRYVQDPVTFLGTRFDLPMFGLSFVGFIRDREADMIDTAAGISEADAQPAAGGVE